MEWKPWLNIIKSFGNPALCIISQKIASVTLDCRRILKYCALILSGKHKHKLIHIYRGRERETDSKNFKSENGVKVYFFVCFAGVGDGVAVAIFFAITFNLSLNCKVLYTSFVTHSNAHSSNYWHCLVCVCVLLFVVRSEYLFVCCWPVGVVQFNP